MPASPTRIGFITQEFRRATSETPSAQTRHGTLARESEDPVETFFDNVADAQLIADARQALFSPERRRFSPRVTGINEAISIDYLSGTIPVAHYIDAERAVDRNMILTEITLDFSKQQAELPVWG